MIDCQYQPPFCTGGIDCGLVYVAPLYFMGFFTLGVYLMLNLFIAVIIDNFSQAYNKDPNQITTDDLEQYRYACPHRCLPHIHTGTILLLPHFISTTVLHQRVKRSFRILIFVLCLWSLCLDQGSRSCGLIHCSLSFLFIRTCRQQTGTTSKNDVFDSASGRYFWRKFDPDGTGFIYFSQLRAFLLKLDAFSNGLTLGPQEFC